MKIFTYIKELREIRRLPIGTLKIVEQIFKFIQETADKKHPLMTQIATIETQDRLKVNTWVTLWAGIGDNDPIKRCGELKAQNEEMKELLRSALKEGITEDLKMSIYLAIDHFN